MLDRAKLGEAIEKLSTLEQNSSKKIFTWSGIIDEPVDLKALHINRVGLVTMPLKHNDIVKLSKNFHLNVRKSLSQTRDPIPACWVDASEITLISEHGGASQQSILKDLTYKALGEMLDINFKNLSFDVQLKMEEFLVCADGLSHSNVLSPFSEPGKFGTLLVKMPLKASKSSGNVVINDGTRKTQLELGDNSCFSVTVLAGECSSSREASLSVSTEKTGEMIAVMIFHLIWNDSVIFGKNDVLSPSCFPELALLTSQLKTALASWTEASTQENQNADQPALLCLPVSGTVKEELDLSELPSKDLITLKCLSHITVVDVHLACIKITKNAGKPSKVNSKGSYAPEAVMSPTSSLQFKKVNQIPHKIFDGLSEYPIVAANNLLGEPSFYGLEERSERCSFPAIVVRPRNIEHVVAFNEKNKSKPELFLESLAKRLIDYAEKKVLENKFVNQSLLDELKQIIDYLIKEDHPATVCHKCLYFRLFDTCYQLKAKDFGLLILSDVLNKKGNIGRLFVCKCTYRPYDVDPAIAFARFVFLTDGWRALPDVMKKLTNQMLAEGFNSIVSEIAMNLFKNKHCVLGGDETFQLIFEAVRNSLLKPEEFKKMFHVGLVTLAIHVCRKDRKNNKGIQLLSSGMKNLEPSQLTELTEHLGRLFKDESLDCKSFLNKELGTIFVETSFQNFTPQQFLLVAGVYRSTNEPEIVKSFWKSLYSPCIEIFNSKSNVTCLFCWILREKKSTEVRNEILACNTQEFKKAIKCSIQKLPNYSEHFNADSGDEYISFISLLEGHIAKDEIFQHISAVFPRLNPNVMVDLAHSLLYSNFSRVTKKGSTMREIYECLLKQICQQELDVILSIDAGKMMICSAWSGALDVVKLFVGKLDDAIATSKMTHSTKLTSIFRPLKLGSSAAVVLNFNRDVLHYLLCESLKTIGKRINRAADTAACFKHLAASERTFIDSTPAFVTEQWHALLKSFDFLETSTVLVNIFESEINHSGPNLKKFPNVWDILKQTCSSLLSKCQTTTADRISAGLTEENVVALMQCFFWIGEEKGIVDFSHFVNELQRSHKKFVHVHSAIIREKRTADLATSSVHATLAFNDLIDNRIQILNERLANSGKVVSCHVCQTPTHQVVTYNSSEGSSTKEPAKKYQKVDCHPESLSADWKKEIEELQALRKQIFTKSLLNQSQTSLKC